jgi:hypothetical protein
MNNPPSETPAPQNTSATKTILVIVSVLVVLCCLCTAVTGGGAAAYFTLIRPKIETANHPFFPTEEAVQVQESPFPVEDTPTVENTPELVDTPTVENTPEARNTPEAEVEPTLTHQASGPDDFRGLGVSREEMISFYNTGDAFTFSDPTTMQGLEIVQGTHSWLCVESNCAAVTLGGPANDLLVISVVVPTKPDDSTQTTLGLLLLMTTAARFTDPQSASSVPTQVMEEIFNAQKTSQDLEEIIESNGYEFTVNYNAQTQNAGLAVTRPK